MKVSYFLLLLVFCCNCLSAQDDPNGVAACHKPISCTLNLNTSQYASIATQSGTYFKTNLSGDCKDVSYQDDYGTCHGGAATNCNADPKLALIYNVYYPANVNYSTCKLPCVILIHGGEFADCAASLAANDIVQIATNLALRGFVVYSMEYRRGVRVVANYYSAQ